MTRDRNRELFQREVAGVEEVQLGVRQVAPIGQRALANERRIPFAPHNLHGCVDFYGTALEIHDRWMQLFSSWLPGSAYEPDDRPGLERYGDDSVMEPETGRFSCQLCLPVRPA